jgi:hypothetical protein
VRTAPIIVALMMEAVHTSETLVNFNVTIWDFILATITQRELMKIKNLLHRHVREC